MKKIILTIAAIGIASVSAFSQSVTETRHIKTTALQIYENYKVVMSGLYSKGAYTEDNFMALFDNSAILYNDILPDNNPQKLSPANYYAKFKASINRIYPDFSDFKMEEPVSVGDKWQIKCNFTRGTRFKTLKDMNYPEWSFNYTMTIEMDKKYDTNKKVYESAKIVNVDVKNPLKGFFILENKENMSFAAKSGETLKDWDAEYNSRIFPEDKWKIHEIQVSDSNSNKNFFGYSKSSFSKNRTDAHFYQPDIQRFKKNIFGIGVKFSQIAMGNNTSGANAENFKENNALSFSLFYGKQIAQGDKSTWFFDIGLDLNWYSYKYSATNGAVPSKDPIQDIIDKDMYLPKININDKLSESINVFSVSVPLSVQYLYQLSQSNKPVFLSFELGVFAEYILSSTSKDSPNVNYHGIYNTLFPDGSSQTVEFDHYYDFGDNIPVDRNLKLASHFDYGILGGIGVWFTLDNSDLLKFNVLYKSGFNSSLKYTEDYNFSKSSNISLSQSAKNTLQNIYFGISWVKTIGGKK